MTRIAHTSLLSLLILLVLGTAVVPAQAGVTLSREPAGVLRLVGDDADDRITLPFVSGYDEIAVPLWPLSSHSGCGELQPISGGTGLVCTGVTKIVFSGGGGDDVFDPLLYLGMPVELDGGPGNDRLTGGSADDLLRGGADADALTGGGGNDLLDGGAGIDVIGEGGRVVLPEPGATSTGNGGPGESDTITAVEDVHGSEGPDDITGNSGPNVLRGGMGRDTLRGGGGDDTIYGHVDTWGDSLIYNNADAIEAGPGADTVYSRDGNAEDLDCGSGADRVHSDTKLDRVVSCEVVAAEVFGELRFEGTPRADERIVMSGVEVRGTPMPTPTYVWRRCIGLYTCTEISTAASLLLTTAEVGTNLHLRGTVTYSNGFETATAEAGPMGSIQPPLVTPRPPAPPQDPRDDRPPSTPTPPPPGRGVSGPPAFDALVAARAALGPGSVRMPRWSSSQLAAARAAGPIPLSRRAGEHPFAAFACAAPRSCSVVLRPRLVTRARTVTFSPIRLRIAPGKARVARLRTPAAVRRALRGAGAKHLDVGVTATPGARVPKRLRLPVS